MINFLGINRNSILKEGNPVLREVSKELEFPLSKENENLIDKMITYLYESNDEEVAMIKNLEPSVGIAAPQIGKNIRMFCVFKEEGINDIDFIEVINPKILKYSEELAFLPSGEGCLSVPNRKEGLVYRSNEIEVEYYNKKGEKIIRTLKGFEAIAFQHEYDHLDGKLYIDHINKKDPFMIKEGAKEIQ